MKKLIAVIISCIMILSVFSSCKKNGTDGKVTGGESGTTLVDLTGVCGTSAKYSIEKAMVAYYAYEDLNYYSSMYGGQFDFSSYMNTFIDGAQERINRYVILASKALDSGYTLTEEDNKVLEQTAEQMVAVAEASGSSINDYLAETYTSGVTLDAVKKCLQLEQLAYKYYDDIEKNTKPSDKELEDYRLAHPEAFNKVEFMFFSFDAGITDSTPENERAEKLAAAHQKALDFIEIAKDVDSFKAEVIKRSIEQAREAVEAEGKEFVRDTDENYLKSATISDYAYQENNKLCEWAFNSERKVGDIGIVEMETGYYACLINKTSYFDTYRMATVRQIIYASVNHDNDDAKTKQLAEDVLKKFKEGEQTEEAFAELAKLNSDDTASINNGGLCRDVAKGILGVPAIENWCIDENRKAGDTEIIKADYGYHVMYFISHGDVVWESDAKSAILTEKINSIIEELSDQYKVTFDKAAIDSIL